MNAGLSNLATLKLHLLPGTMQSDTRFDSVLTDIGRGVAAAMDKFCNRKFARAADDTFEFPTARDFVILPRYPVQSVASVQLRYSVAEGWQTFAEAVINRDDSAGIVYFGYHLGSRWTQGRITFTGGFWFEDKEPADGGYPTTQPNSSTALPADLRLAWLLQCAHVWDSKDRLGVGLTEKPKEQSALITLELAPQVKQMLSGFIRYAIS